MSLKSWAKQFKWTIQQVRTFFKLLEKDLMITSEGMRKTTRITICNYESYQETQHTDNTQITHKQHTTNTQITTNKNDKKEKNIRLSPRENKILNYKPSNDEEINLQKWIDAEYPNIQKLKLPLIAPELKSIAAKFGKDLVSSKLSAMENKKNLTKDYLDAGRTLENWCKINTK